MVADSGVVGGRKTASVYGRLAGGRNMVDGEGGETRNVIAVVLLKYHISSERRPPQALKTLL